MWYRISCFRATAENVQQYVKVGDPLMVVGDRLKIAEWTDKDGNARVSLELQAQRVVFLKARDDQPTPSGSAEEMPF
jgi:single-stranded DNA-binding protein